MTDRALSPRKIDAAFKLEVVRMVLDKHMSVSATSQVMQIGDTAIRRWVRQYKAAQASSAMDGPVTVELMRIQQLEAENRQLREDNDILKKASAFFARSLS